MTPTTVRHMKPDIAERLAAATVDCVTVEEARTIIREFLSRLARCPACEDTGTFTYGRKVHVLARVPNGGNAHQKDVTIDARTIGTCPRCGGGNGDPDWVAWYCEEPDARTRCSPLHGLPQGHESCSWRLVLPLDLLEDRS